MRTMERDTIRPGVEHSCMRTRMEVNRKDGRGGMEVSERKLIHVVDGVIKFPPDDAL